MGLFVERKNLKLYPHAITELQKPVHVSFIEDWRTCVFHCLGGGGSGLSGAVVNGKLITTGTVADLNTWAQGPP